VYHQIAFHALAQHQPRRRLPSRIAEAGGNGQPPLAIQIVIGCSAETHAFYNSVKDSWRPRAGEYARIRAASSQLLSLSKNIPLHSTLHHITPHNSIFFKILKKMLL
jgi:hypothetical protein